MIADNSNMERLEAEIKELKSKLFEANSIIEAISEGDVDALVLNKNGTPQVYSMESADYTYRVLIEKFGEGALSISSDGLILYCNDYFAKMAQLPTMQITGTYFQSYVQNPDEFFALIEQISDGPSKGQLSLNFAGKEFFVHISLTDLHPNVEAIGVVVTDLTEKLQSEAALELYRKNLEIKVNELHLTNNNLEQFIHVISHDLKEPLRKILTYTSHLSSTRNELFNTADIKNLNLIHNSAFRLNSLVDDLVKYAFTSQQQQTQMVNLNEVLREVLDDLEIVIQDNRAKVDCFDLPQINGSRLQLRQLFANLISNAMKYAQKGIPAQIEIRHDAAKDPTGFLCIAVADNGIGMEPSHINKIFTIFQRLHLRGEYSGNGIGLAICKKIMENHSGRIEVQSQPGKGSTFSLYFPI